MEHLLAGLEFPKTAKLLSDPNIWIADSAATVHATTSEFGTVPILGKNDENRADSITMGSGASESVSKIANIPGVICDKMAMRLHLPHFLKWQFAKMLNSTYSVSPRCYGVDGTCLGTNLGWF